jgi:hypothetical protein
MGDNLERIFEFRVLYAKQRDLRIRLTWAEKERFARLQRDLSDRVPSVDDRDPFTVLAAPLTAQFVVSGRFGGGVLRNASAVGLAITTGDEPPELGRRLILHVHDAVRGIEYTFPCRVVARVVKAPASIGLRFEGMPAQTRRDDQTGSVWPAADAPEPDTLSARS